MSYEQELREMPSKVLIDELFDALDIEPVSAELLRRLEAGDRLREALRTFCRAYDDMNRDQRALSDAHLEALELIGDLFGRAGAP